MPTSAYKLPADGLHVGDIYEEHFAYVWRTLRSLGVPGLLLDDAVQDVFVVVQRRVGGFEGRSAVKTWLFSIARNVAANHRRRDAKLAHRELPLVGETPADTKNPHQALENAEAVDALVRILECMTSEHRDVFVAVDIEGMSAPEAGRALAVKVNTVYSRLRAAREQFECEIARRLKRQRSEQ